jgi:hypothetical protein
MYTSSTLAAVAAFLAMTVAGESTTANSTSQSLTTTAAPSASSGSTYISLFEAGYSATLGASNLAGSIIDANAVATTIAINCIEVNADCDGGTKTLTQGPSTWVIDYTTRASIDNVDATMAIDMDCNIASSTAATCTLTEVVKLSADGEKTSSTASTTETFSGSQVYYDQLLITAGLDKLTSPQATETPSGAAGVVAAPLPTGNVGMGVGGIAAAAIVAVAGML